MGGEFGAPPLLPICYQASVGERQAVGQCIYAALLPRGGTSV